MITPEQWHQITTVFQAAVARDPPSRRAFLDEACRADAVVRAEVDRLLVAHHKAGRFGEDPLAAFPLSTPLDADADLSASGPLTSASPPSRPGHRHPFLAGVWLAAALVLVLFTYGAWLLVPTGARTVSLGWRAVRDGQAWHVAGIRPSGPAADDLRPGDRIVTMNGAPPLTTFGLYFDRRGLSVGDTYDLVVERDGERHELRLVVGQAPTNTGRVMYFLVSLVWCAVGLFIGFARPEKPLSRLACAAAVMTGLVFLDVGVIHSGPLLQPLHVVLGFHFFARFPADRPLTGIWKWALGLMYVAGGIQAVPDLAVHAAVLALGPAAAREMVTSSALLFSLGPVVSSPAYAAAQIGMVVALARNYRPLKDEDLRRRVRWVVYGAAVGLLMQVWWAAVYLFEQFVGPAPVSKYSLLANALTVAIPLTVAYAVVRHRVMDIKVVVRRGVQYLLARRVLQTAVALPIMALVYTLAHHRDLTIAQLVSDTQGYLYWAGAASLALTFRGPLGRSLDRRFFREVYDREQLLFGLLEEVRKADSISELACVVSDRLTRALHPTGAYVWYRDPDEFALVSSSDPRFTPPDDSSSGAWLTWLEQQGEATALPLPPEAGLSRRGARWFSDRGISLIVPLMDTGDRLVGALLLGGKKSQEPYSVGDARLLSAIARQTAVARENLRLRACLGKEVRVKHDVLARLDNRLPNLLKECPDCGACFDGAVDRCLADGRLLALSLPVPRTIDGKYRLDRQIGKGGMGAVYEARDLRLERVVAVKILLGPAFGQQSALRRFRREARATAHVSHPNIVALYDYGSLEGDGAYLVMERLEGVTLRAELEARTSLPPALAADWFDPLLDGLAAAHARGIIHRDLKPENVMGLQAAPGTLVVKILDLGLAKFRTEDPPTTASVTAEGVVMGTPSYMSPEQLLGRDVDQRTDIFAVAVMLIEALTGLRPLKATDPRRPRTLAGWPDRARATSVQVRELDSLVRRCLAEDPQARFPSAGVLRAELIPLLRACPPLEAARDSTCP